MTVTVIIINNSGDLLDNNNYVIVVHATVASKLFFKVVNIIQGYHISYYMCQLI